MSKNFSRTDIERPIFVHLMNRELNGSIQGIDAQNTVLRIIRTLSFVSARPLFCNVSQIYEFSESNQQLIKEIIEQCSVGRMLPHSDYQTHEEFIESRLSLYPHDQGRYPQYFRSADDQLGKLVLTSVGEIGSTTSAIESTLFGWLEDDKNNKLSRWIDPLDHVNLKKYEREIVDTLDRREGRGLTFSIFPETMGQSPPKLVEGALRRSLSAIYVDHYTSGHDAHIVWGVEGMDYYEKLNLMTSLNLKFATFVLEETGLFSELKRKPNFGLKDRIANDKSAELARFRNAYRHLSNAFDGELNQCSGHLEKRSFIDVIITNLRLSGALKLKTPMAENFEFSDLISRAADQLSLAASKEEFSPTRAKGLIIVASRDHDARLVAKPKLDDVKSDYQKGVIEHDNPKIKTIKITPEAKSSFDWWYVVSGLIAVVAAVACFYGLNSFSELDLSALLSGSLLAGIFAFGIAAYFNERHYYKRLIPWLMIPIITSSMGLKLELSGNGDKFGGYVSTGHPTDTTIVICFSLLIFASLVFDFLKNR